MQHVSPGRPEAFHSQFIDRFYRGSSWGILGRLMGLGHAFRLVTKTPQSKSAGRSGCR